VVTDERSELLQRARARVVAGDYAGVVALLGAMERADLLAEPELGFTLATALRRVGDWERAVELTGALAGPCARQGRSWLARRRLNLEAALHFDRGRLQEAALRWAELVDAASRAGDDQMLSDACNNLGVVFTLLARTDEALASYGRALAAAQRLGDRRGMAQAQHNLAIAYRELGFLREAGEHFERAVAHATLAGVHEILGRAEEERALVLLQEGDARLAEATATRALDRFRRHGDRPGEGEALRVLGIIALARRQHAPARAHLEAALALARASHAPLLEAETLEALAALAEALAAPAAGAAAPGAAPDPAAGAAAGAAPDPATTRPAGGAVAPEPGARAIAAPAERAQAERIFSAMGAEAWGRQVRSRLHALIAPSSG
jgi:tetratricopeptide (TPR) repeat protein